MRAVSKACQKLLPSREIASFTVSTLLWGAISGRFIVSSTDRTECGQQFQRGGGLMAMMSKDAFKRKRAWKIATISLLACSLFFILTASASYVNKFEVDRVWKQRLRTMGSLVADEIAAGGKMRAELYDRMAADLDKNGAAFLSGGETSQSLKLSDLFKIEDGEVTPVLKAADPPVRATVLHLDGHYALQISAVVKKVLSPYFPGGIWYQDLSFYHFSLFHASHHLESVPAAWTEVEAEAVEKVARRCCPLEIVLDRVVLTSTGVLLACWQVLNGTEPATIRKELRNSLPNAPNKQLYDPVILHTSIARILGPPKLSSGDGRSSRNKDTLIFMKSLVSEINEELANFQAKINELWFVEEFDILALALKGRLAARKFPLHCSSSR